MWPSNHNLCVFAASSVSNDSDDDTPWVERPAISCGHASVGSVRRSLIDQVELPAFTTMDHRGTMK